jgi:hypothetical protein
MKLKFMVLIIVALVMTGCMAKEDDSTSATMLQIESITDQDGELPVFSSVAIDVNDNCTLSIKALPIDPMLEDETAYYNVLIDQIDVQFKRTDGRNVEGVDVPYSFTQPLSYLVPLNGTAEIPFMLIRHVAKLETPLLALREFPNQAKVLQLVGVVTAHGKDLGGHRVAPVTGYVSVWCSSQFDTASSTVAFAAKN